MKIVDTAEFVEEVARYDIGFDTGYPHPQTLGFQNGHLFEMSIPRDINGTGTLIAQLLEIYEDIEPLWVWRRSGTWVPSQWDLDGWRGSVIRGLEGLGLPLAQGAIRCDSSDKRLLPAMLLLWASVQRSVDDDVFLVGTEKLPVAWIDHDGELFLDCASEEAVFVFRSHFAHWL